MIYSELRNKKEGVKIKRIIVLGIMLMLLVGCDTLPGDDSSVWQVNLTSYRLTNWISESGHWGYAPDPGYDWLVINLQVTNTTKETQNLDWFTDQFQYIAANKNVYDQRLQFNEPEGYIETRYNPQQTKEGFIAFEVPEGISVTEGKLIFKDRTFDLDYLPVQEAP